MNSEQPAMSKLITLLDQSALYIPIASYCDYYYRKTRALLAGIVIEALCNCSLD